MRYKLAAENRAAKYLRYAIGEILLVVIGIVIALQINNWNENQKAHRYEIKMLSESRNALIHDLDFFDYLVNERLARTDSLNTVLLDLHLKNLPVPDSLISKMNILDRGYLFYYNSGPYEAIKSSGMDKISNDSIRNALVQLYDFYLPWTTSALEIPNKTWDKQREYFNLLFTPIAHKEGDNIKINKTEKYKEFWLREEYEPLLIQTATYVGGAQYRIQEVMVSMENCLRLIDKELGKSP
ncbi:DUF6090 family protein [Maribellus mangrovi]|uniref:DUF6090 family protein n=1 Tax=Maribellus mangrovi TaxID=3133146 RepID=UPI0030EBC8B5